MNSSRGVKFHHASAPYEIGDIAGFSAVRAQRYVDSGVAQFWPPLAEVAADVASEPDILEGMDRAQLIAFGRQHLGIADEPQASVSDEDLREAIRGSVDALLLKVAPHAEAPAVLMQVAPAGKNGKSK